MGIVRIHAIGVSKRIVIRVRKLLTNRKNLSLDSTFISFFHRTMLNDITSMTGRQQRTRLEISNAKPPTLNHSGLWKRWRDVTEARIDAQYITMKDMWMITALLTPILTGFLVLPGDTSTIVLLVSIFPTCQFGGALNKSSDSHRIVRVST